MSAASACRDAQFSEQVRLLPCRVPHRGGGCHGGRDHCCHGREGGRGSDERARASAVERREGSCLPYTSRDDSLSSTLSPALCTPIHRRFWWFDRPVVPRALALAFALNISGKSISRRVDRAFWFLVFILEPTSAWLAGGSEEVSVCLAARPARLSTSLLAS